MYVCVGKPECSCSIPPESLVKKTLSCATVIDHNNYIQQLKELYQLLEVSVISQNEYMSSKKALFLRKLNCCNNCIAVIAACFLNQWILFQIYTAYSVTLILPKAGQTVIICRLTQSRKRRPRQSLYLTLGVLWYIGTSWNFQIRIIIIEQVPSYWHCLYCKKAIRSPITMSLQYI